MPKSAEDQTEEMGYMIDETTSTTRLRIHRQPIIRIIELHKWYGEFHVLKDINLTVNKGERIVICGPSGSGKSTLIRCINRLEEHQRGRIIVDNIELTNDIKNIEKIRAEVGMVFQHFNLFPHLTMLENLTLGPIWVRKTPRAEAEETAMYYPGKGPYRRTGQKVSRPAFGRPAAAGRHCPQSLYEAEGDAL